MAIDPRERNNPVEELFKQADSLPNGEAAEKVGERIIAKLDEVAQQLSNISAKSFLKAELSEETIRKLSVTNEAQVRKWMRSAWSGVVPRDPPGPKGERLPRVGGQSAGEIFGPPNTANTKWGRTKQRGRVLVGDEMDGVRRFFTDARGVVIRPDGGIMSPSAMPKALMGLAKKGLLNRPGEGYGSGIRFIGGHAALSGAINPAMLRRYSRIASGTYGHLLGGHDIDSMTRLGLRGTHGAGTAGAGFINQLLGLETIGYLTGSNLAFGGEAQRAGIGDRIDSFRASFNPFDALSFEDDQKIKGLTRGMGFRFGSTQERDVIREMRSLRNKGFQPEEVSAYIELFVKKLNVAADEVGKTIEQFQERAVDSGKSLEEYTKIVTETSQRMVAQGVDPKTAQVYSDFAAQFKHVTPDALASIGTELDVHATQVLSDIRPELLSEGGLMRFRDNPETALGDDLAEFKQRVVQRGVQFWMQSLGLSEKDAINRYAADKGLTPAAVRELYEMDPTQIRARQDRLGWEEDLLKGQSALEDIEREAKLTSSKTFVLRRNEAGEIVGVGYSDAEKRAAEQRAADARAEQDRLVQEYRQSLIDGGDISGGEIERIDKMIARGEDPAAIIEEVRRITGRREEMEESRAKVDVMIDASPRLKQLLNIQYTVDQAKTDRERNQRNTFTFGVKP